jgi:hypothetical protein
LTAYKSEILPTQQKSQNFHKRRFVLLLPKSKINYAKNTLFTATTRRQALEPLSQEQRECAQESEKEDRPSCLSRGGELALKREDKATRIEQLLPNRFVSASLFSRVAVFIAYRRLPLYPTLFCI